MTAPSVSIPAARTLGGRARAGSDRFGGLVEAWLRGIGAVPLYNLMEDAATAEISRSQVWQWLHWNARLADGRQVTPELVEDVITDEMRVIAHEVGEGRMTSGRFDEARELFAGLVFAKDIPEFLTTVAYDRLVTPDPNP